jgi:hypothetical protein
MCRKLNRNIERLVTTRSERRQKWILNLILRNSILGHERPLSHSGICKYGNKLPGSVRSGGFLEQLSNDILKDSSSWN